MEKVHHPRNCRRSIGIGIVTLLAISILLSPSLSDTHDDSDAVPPRRNEYGKDDVLMIDGFQASAALQFANTQRSKGFAGKIVVLTLQALPDTPTRLADDLVVFGAATDVRAKLQMAVPLLLALEYLRYLDTAPDIVRVLFVSPSDVLLCGNAFDLIADPGQLHVVFGQWDYVEENVVGASPMLFGGGVEAMTSFLEIFRSFIAKNVTRSGELRFQHAVAALSTPVATFDPILVVEATNGSCDDDMRRATCSGTRLVAAVDIRRCSQLGHVSSIRHCPTHLQKSIYSRTYPSYGKRTALLPLHIQTVLKKALPAPMPYLPVVKAYTACPLLRRSAVLGMAANLRKRHAVYGDRLKPFVNSFLASANRRCTDLVLFMNGPRPADPGYDRVVWVDMSDFQLTERPTCKPKDSRMEYFHEWLARSGALSYAMIAIVDVDDVFFQADPFASLVQWKGWADVTATAEWLLMPAESVPIAHRSPYVPKTFELFKTWQDRLFGKAYRKALTNATLPSGESLPMLNSGLLVGSGQAVAGLLQVMFGLLKPTMEGDVCGIDQALLTMLVFDGLAAGKFPARVWIANPEYFVFRHGVERPVDALWVGEALVNCDGRRYSVVHRWPWQLTTMHPWRHPWVHRRTMRARIEEKKPAASVVQGKRKVTADSLADSSSHE